MRRALSATCFLAAIALSSGCKSPTTNSSSQSALPPTATSAEIAANWKALEKAKVNPSDYNLESFPSNEIEKHMTPGSDAQGLPANLQGIWWMDGNLLAPGNVTTFANLEWDKAHQKTLVQEYGAGNYTFNDDDSGRKSFNSSCTENVNFEIDFNDQYTFGQLIQVVRVPGIGVAMKISKALVNYTMDWVPAEDAWLRKSWWGPKALPDYKLRRIVDAKGNHLEPAFSNFLKAAPPRSLIPQNK